MNNEYPYCLVCETQIITGGIVWDFIADCNVPRPMHWFCSIEEFLREQHRVTKEIA